MSLRSYQLKSLNMLSLLMLIALFISKITGQLRVILVGQRLGFDTIYADAFSQGFLLPDLIFALLIGGSIQAAIVPYLSQGLAAKKEKETWQTLSSFMTILASLMAIFLLISAWQAPFIMRYFTTESSYEATVAVSRALMPQAFFMMMAGFIVGILNSYRYFIASALLPSIYNLLVCLSVVFFAKKSIHDLSKTAWAITCVAALYFLAQLFIARKLLKYYQPSFNFFSPETKNLFRTAFPTLLASAIPMLSTFVISSYYDRFPNGIAYAYNNASSVGLLPFGIFVVAIGNVLLPHLSTALVEGNGETLYIDSLKKVILTIVPSTLILIFYKEEVVRVIFQWGKIPVSSLSKTSDLLPYYALLLIFFSLNYLFNLVLYAQRKTYLSLFASFCNLLMLIISSYLIVVIGSYDYRGMAISLIISHAFQTIVLFFILRRNSVFLLPMEKAKKLPLYLLLVLFTMVIVYLLDYLKIPLEARKIRQISILGLKSGVVFVVFFFANALCGLLPSDMQSAKITGIINFFKKKQQKI